MMGERKTVIMGAGGRDFHNFNVVYREDRGARVVAFTAAQIPGIESRTYPPELAGPLYPQGIPIVAESELEAVVRKHGVEDVVFAYSDVSHEEVMHAASRAAAVGCDFRLLGPGSTMLKAKVPVVAVVAVRTGSGKSQTTRYVASMIRAAGKRVVAVRHPMPYGQLAKQRLQRFATYEDLDKHECTIEEREEYEPHLKSGTVVYAGVDYAAILAEAEKEADVILWDGGNNDFAFFAPDLTITVVDPHRPGHELRYHPGEINFRLADVIVINKMESAPPEGIEIVRANIRRVNPQALVVEAASPITVDDPAALTGKRVLVIEDGPTLTHGGMTYGAGVVAARKFGAELIDPRPYVVGQIKAAFERYPGIGPLLPALGYGPEQIADLERTVHAVPADAVVIATPIDLRRLIHFDRPA
ncbi:MAG TPA: cyclic 2,3-diphosphoglycerate synthase, partial [Candidatus Udaeobacter sp.]|nr:cyclic 2,3-diphosphoglycerate synthase [Candidatus Udaeobacter sp.]